MTKDRATAIIIVVTALKTQSSRVSIICRCILFLMGEDLSDRVEFTAPTPSCLDSKWASNGLQRS